jgi:two-component system sensor histidine kinase FlrB
MPQLKSFENTDNVKLFVAKSANAQVDGRTEALDQMVDSFSAMSRQLNQSYTFLEDRVSELTSQLDSMNQQADRAIKDQRKLNARMEGLLDILPGGVVIIDQQGRVVDCNPVAKKLLGDSLCGSPWSEIIQRRFAPRSDDGCEISLRDGRRVSLATSSLPDGNGQIVLLTDQTETRRLQGLLSRHQRLSSMGKMMSSLAHQIRTPLSSAMLYAEHLQNETLSPSMTRKFSSKVLARLHQLEAQVRDMLVFARGEVDISDVLSCQALLDEWAEQAREAVRSVSAPCHVQLNATCTRSLIACNKEILLGALMNLVNNAVEAIAAGGDGEGIIKLSVEKNGDNVAFFVSDNGPGFTAKALEGIQQAFFTTKSTGTGLGLSVVRSIAAAHHGRFLIERPAHGAKVGIQLPIVHTKEV